MGGSRSEIEQQQEFEHGLVERGTASTYDSEQHSTFNEEVHEFGAADGEGGGGRGRGEGTAEDSVSLVSFITLPFDMKN